MNFEVGPKDLTTTIAGAETLKLAALHTLDVFYTPLEERFERVTRMARRLLRVPVAAVTMMNDEKQWFKSVAGWTVSELPLDKSMCTWTLTNEQPTIAEDTLLDPRFALHPLVVGKPYFRFYAGYPLRDKLGATTATLSVFDFAPREFSSDDMQSLRDVGGIAQQELLADYLNNAQSELISKLGTARREAMFDPLTRVWNRRGATSFLREAIAKAEDQHSDIAVCLMDIDNFKTINDSYGHQVGDEVLRKTAAVLVSCLRTDDIVCRYGGDEFLLILPKADPQLATQIAERTRVKISETPVATRQGKVQISVTIGCVSRVCGDRLGARALIERADEALLSGKGLGRNRVALAG